MLILSRRTNESIIVDSGKIKFTIMSVVGRHVKIAIEAPDEITIDREEIYLRKLENPNFKKNNNANEGDECAD
jgi:carbon storage regulator